MEDIASKISVISVHSMTEETNFWVHVSQGSAETLASGGRWDNKSPVNSLLTQQHLCKKMTKIG